MRHPMALLIAALCAAPAFECSGDDHPAALRAQVSRPARAAPHASGATISRADYADRLRAMWLGESIANWTGLVTEGQRQGPPFFTDADWGTFAGRPSINGTGQITFVFQDPWGSDDDTDIEYIYLSAMSALNRTTLEPREIADAWEKHIRRGAYIWVSNLAAHEAMTTGPSIALPPSTSLLSGNDQALMIDAQLTTEIFGALAPGAPREALRIADLPIRVTATGYAAHAAQFFVALYALAAVVDRALPPREQVLWMVERARKLIPATSKTADLLDFVLADYRSNPDVNDWERTRDAVARRYQLHAEENGFRYLAWYESGVNVATALLALLYGEGDYKRTIQIGALAGWDSDNGTATMGGLLGLLYGTQKLKAQFPGVALSDRYDILRTRINFPGEDTFTEMAARMLPLVARSVVAAGGRIDEATGDLILPAIDLDALSAAADNPLCREDARSANNNERRQGSGVSVVASGLAEGGLDGLPGSGDVALCADGLETDFSGRDRRLRVRGIHAYPGSPAAPLFFTARGSSSGEPIRVAVTYNREIVIDAIRFIEGPSFLEGNRGGWFETILPEILVDGVWRAPEGVRPSEALRPAQAFQIIDFALPRPTRVRGVRLTGQPGGEARFVTIAEIDALQAVSRDAALAAAAESPAETPRPRGWSTGRTGLPRPRDNPYR